MARGIRCEAHRHMSIVAEENHHLQPRSRGGLNVRANMRYLCANAHGDVHYLLDLIEDYAVPLVGGNWKPITAYKEIPIATRRTFGKGVTTAALDGWARYGDRFVLGVYDAHRLLWHTGGQPREGAYNRVGGGMALPTWSAAELMGTTNTLLHQAERTLRNR